MKIVAAGVRYPEQHTKNETTAQLPFDCVRPKGSPTDLVVDMSLPLCRQLLEEAGIRPEELDMILSISVTPDRLVNSPEVGAPRLCHPLQRDLGANEAFVFDLLDADWSTAIDVANGFAVAQDYKHVLVIRAELTAPSIVPDEASGFAIPDGVGALILTNSAQTTNTQYLSLSTSNAARLELLDASELSKEQKKAKLTFGYEPQKVVQMNELAEQAVEQLIGQERLSADALIAESWFPEHAIQAVQLPQQFNINEAADFKNLGPFTLPHYAQQLIQQKRSKNDQEESVIVSLSFNPFLLQYGCQFLTV